MNKLVILFLLGLGLASTAVAKSKKEINILADATLERFTKEVTGGQSFLNQASAVLIFPQVLKAGFGIGGEYGEGVLRVNGQSTAYYSTAAASIGFQAGAQSKSVVVVFMNAQAVADFRRKKVGRLGWMVPSPSLNGELERTSIPWILKIPL